MFMSLLAWAHSPVKTIDDELVGEPLRSGQRTIQPIARVTGRIAEGGNRRFHGGGAMLRIIPVAVLVRESNGTEHRIPIGDETRTVLRGILIAAVLVAAVCWTIMLIRNRTSRSTKQDTEEQTDLESQEETPHVPDHKDDAFPQTD
jgi:uncharacterized spore protein YtfJ